MPMLSWALPMRSQNASGNPGLTPFLRWLNLSIFEVSVSCIYAVMMEDSNGDGTWRGTVTTPVLAPYENHPDQH